MASGASFLQEALKSTRKVNNKNLDCKKYDFIASSFKS